MKKKITALFLCVALAAIAIVGASLAYFSDTKETAQRHLDMWLEAEAAVSTGQSYQIEQMVLTRASLKQIRESIAFWEKKVAEAEAEERGRGRNRIYHFSPHDV